jgi:hypothetical protein
VIYASELHLIFVVVDLHLNCTPNVELKYYLKVQFGLIENNYELIQEVKYFEEL